MRLITHILACSMVLYYGICAAVNPPDDNKFIVVLDAGHGGKDPGKVSNGYNEKDIALKIALEVGKELEKDPKIKVVYTRKTDVFIDLFVRGKIANEAHADLFISIHCNAHNSDASGAETYVLGLHANKRNFEVAKAENEVIYLEENYETNYEGFDLNSPESTINIIYLQEEFLEQSIELAKLIQDNFTNKLKRKNRGVKQAGFIVLHQTFMPSVLIETGFITNTTERNYLKSSEGQKEISSSIVDAIYKYKLFLDSDSGSVLTVKPPLPTTERPETPIENLDNIPDVVFKVQIAAGTKDLPTKPENFNGLSTISKEVAGNLFKYYYGETNSYTTAKQLLDEAKRKGYSDAYVVAYKNGKKISVSDALKSVPN